MGLVTRSGKPPGVASEAVAHEPVLRGSGTRGGREGFCRKSRLPQRGTLTLRRAVDPETWKIDWRQTGERQDRPRPHCQGGAAGTSDLVGDLASSLVPFQLVAAKRLQVS